MFKLKGIFKSGLCLGMALTLMLSGTSCGKKAVEVKDYGMGSDDGSSTTSDNDSDDKTNAAESDSENVKTGGQSLIETFGENISVNESFSSGGFTANCNLSYKVPEVNQINVYEGSFIDNNADIEKQIVSSFFGGTEKNLDEIKYVNDSDYISLLYKYRNLLMNQKYDIASITMASISEEDYTEYMSAIDSSFDKVYKWVDEVSYYIHMYEGEYNGNRYGMIYSYDKVSGKRNIYVSPISISEYLPEFDAKTLFVIDQKTDLGSDNLCTMSENDIMNDAENVIEKLGLGKKDIVLTVNPNAAIPELGIISGFYSEEPYTEMPKLVFSDQGLMFSAAKLNSINPAWQLHSYKLLKEQNEEDFGEVHSGDVSIITNGKAVYLYSEPFSENIIPQSVSTFNRGSIYYTDKGLYTVDISLVAEIENVTTGVQLLSFDNIKESFKNALENDPDISQRDSASLEVFSVAFTYVLIEDSKNPDKATYVPAWHFLTKDNKLKNREQPITYSHVINAIDGADLRDSLR
ncbi:MAG: hypothetical protein J6M65_00905 [Eubacterium sp.]|nr:hypothetical protein [Eubacterium sp.]